MSDSTILGKYHVLERIGAGSYGVVYRVNVLAGGDKQEEYAVKLERASKKRNRPPSEHENNVLRALAHVDASPGPHIPRAIDYGHDKSFYSKVLVLELLGIDLQCMLKNREESRLPIKNVMLIAIQLISTIQYIHSKDFIHRDIKPGNILLGPRGNEDSIYLVDFGLARRYRNPRTTVHMPFLDGKSLVGTVRYASLNTHLGIAQTRRDDIESLAYSLIDCIRELPWSRIVGGSPKQFEDRVREKKRSWTPERLCVGLPSPFQTLLTHAQGLGFSDEPDYEGIRRAFLKEIESRGWSAGNRLDWSQTAEDKDFVFPRKTSRKVRQPMKTTICDVIKPGDLVKLKLLARPTIQFSGRFNSIQTDPSYWQSPSLDEKQWDFPFRPAIVVSVERDVVVRKGKKGINLSVLPLFFRPEGLMSLPEDAQKRFVPLDSESSVKPEWPLANTYVYNTYATFSVSVDPSIISNKHSEIHWSVKRQTDVEKLEEELNLVCPVIESEQPVQQEDSSETVAVKQSKCHHIQTVFADIAPLTSVDVEVGNAVVWSGRNGWLNEYNQIGRRREQEREISAPFSFESLDSDMNYSHLPPRERRASCTTNMDALDFW